MCTYVVVCVIVREGAPLGVSPVFKRKGLSEM